MDFKDQIQQLSEKIKKEKDMITTEEATKLAFIMPMIKAWGYDVFNPAEVTPEEDCDLTSHGEKIDYAIKKDKQHIIIIECKHCKQNLNSYNTQLAKYFASSDARFGILTNGIEYRFYSDLQKKNIMDKTPFLIINLSAPSDNDIEQLKKFHKSYYNENEILSTAKELKYTTEIRNILCKEFTSPTPKFVKFIAQQVFAGTIYQSVIDYFSPLVKKSISAVINDIKSDKPSDVENPTTQPINKEEKIPATKEELEAYNTIKEILGKNTTIDISRITYYKFKTYFTVRLDDTYWYWICRISLKRKKWIGVPTENFYTKKERIEINSIDDIPKYADKLVSALNIAVNSKNYWIEKEKAKSKA